MPKLKKGPTCLVWTDGRTHPKFKKTSFLKTIFKEINTDVHNVLNLYTYVGADRPEIESAMRYDNKL